MAEQKMSLNDVLSKAAGNEPAPASTPAPVTTAAPVEQPKAEPTTTVDKAADQLVQIKY
jgi:hypothetical protein